MNPAGVARYRASERRLWEWAGVAPSERRVHLGRAGVTVRIQEAGDGPTVVFVHGASNSGVSWAPLVARLDGFRSVVLDRPGCGLSDPLPHRFADGDALGAFADLLVVDLLDALDVEVAHVVGTSFGGYFGLRAAAAHPDRVGRMVVLGWTLGASRLPMFMRLASVGDVGRLLSAVRPNERAVRAMLRRIGLRQALDAGRVPQELVDCYLALLRDTDTMGNELRAFPRLVGPRRRMDDRALLPASLLGRIRTPIHFLWGEEDPFGGADVARRFVDQVPGAGLELLPGAGHAVWIDDPDHVATATRRFLGALRPARPADTGRLREIERAAGAAFADIGLPDVAGDEPMAEELLAAYARGGRSWVITGQGDEAVGYVVVDVIDGCAHVEQISVHPDHQGGGLGRALLDEVERWARGHHLPALTLTTFTDVAWNGPLYAHLGFVALADDELGPGLRSLREDETAHGLDPTLRVCMRRPVRPAPRRSLSR